MTVLQQLGEVKNANNAFLTLFLEGGVLKNSDRWAWVKPCWAGPPSGLGALAQHSPRGALGLGRASLLTKSTAQARFFWAGSVLGLAPTPPYLHAYGDPQMEGANLRDMLVGPNACNCILPIFPIWNSVRLYSFVNLIRLYVFR